MQSASSPKEFNAMRDELYDAMRELAKENHRARVAKNPQRVAFAIESFETEGIRYSLKNPQIGHFHAWDENGRLYQFWASTGKILGSNRRGIKNFIRLLKGR
jgi:FAD/FMN-containing dehydrogenase